MKKMLKAWRNDYGIYFVLLQLNNYTIKINNNSHDITIYSLVFQSFYFVFNSFVVSSYSIFLNMKIVQLIKMSVLIMRPLKFTANLMFLVKGLIISISMMEN